MALLDGQPSLALRSLRHDGSARVRFRGGLRLLGARRDRALACPNLSAVARGRCDGRRYRLDACAQCHGLLMEREVFAAAVTGKRQAATTPAVLPKKVSARQLDRRVTCPSCAATMITDWYYGPGHVVIDRCATCDLVWLDGGELQTIVEAPGPDRLLRSGARDPESRNTHDAHSCAQILSVLMPVYNEARTLSTIVDRVLKSPWRFPRSWCASTTGAATSP